jgi:hypothetical protein
MFKQRLMRIGMEQYFENPIHWKSIMNTVGKVARVGANIVKKIEPYLRLAAKIA